jgi:hypothetical protein
MYGGCGWDILAEVVGRGREERVRRKREKEGGFECDLRGMKGGGIGCLKLYFFHDASCIPYRVISVQIPATLGLEGLNTLEFMLVIYYKVNWCKSKMYVAFLDIN